MSFELAPLVQPHLHVAIVHFPIALLVVGLGCEVLSLLLRADGLRLAGRWMMLLGALAGIPVALSGLYALQEVARGGGGGDSYSAWREVLAASALTEAQWAVLVRHAVLQSGATFIAVVVTVIYLGSSDLLRKLLYLPGLGLLLIAVAATVVGAHAGGQAVYRHGVGVQAEARSATTAPVSGELLAAWFPPIEAHMVLSGLALAVGLAGLACAHRNASVIRGFLNNAPVRGTAPAPKRLPASRLLLASVVLAAGAAMSGLWDLSHDAGTMSPKELGQIALPFPVEQALAPENAKLLRRPGHVAAGIVLVGLPLLLAGYVALRPKSRILLGVGTLLYVAAVGAQLYVGVLLLLDGPLGTLSPGVLVPEAVEKEVEPGEVQP
jgi:uncharacterized membrane protein